MAFENVRMFRPGYAIEYDFFPPTQLKHTLETRLIKNLFFAGQINGTTGYEEAACQGLMAGINAHRKTHDLSPVILKRSEAYIGVLIDDLITKGTEEPYRMFTSRAEFRTLLRQDNADLRLTQLSHSIGLASDERMNKVRSKRETVDQIKEKLKTISIDPVEAQQYLDIIGSAPMQQKQRAIQLLMRPSVEIKGMMNHLSSLQTALADYCSEDLEQAEIQLKYEVYIEKEKEIAKRMGQLEELEIPENFNYDKIGALSAEALQKFRRIKPRTLGQASRISGVNPSDVQILMVYMGR